MKKTFKISIALSILIIILGSIFSIHAYQKHLHKETIFTVVGIQLDSLAASSSLKAGDILHTVNDLPVSDSNIVIAFNQLKLGKPIYINYLRDKQVFSTIIEPSTSAERPDTAGIYISTTSYSLNITQTLWQGLSALNLTKG